MMKICFSNLKLEPNAFLLRIIISINICIYFIITKTICNNDIELKILFEWEFEYLGVDKF